MNSKKEYRVAIIGAGKIGCGFDSPDSRRILTHAHAFSQNSRTKLVAIVDTNRSRGKKEARRWNTEYFYNIDRMFEEAKPDVVVIATPDETHAGILISVLAKRPKLVVCEKPIVTEHTDAARVKRSVARARVPVIINLSRRFDPVVAKVQSELMRGDFGKIISASGIYVRGILHNGSHMLDLARFLFGEILSAKVYSRLRDFPAGEASVGGFARFARCPRFNLMHADGRKYWVFEMDIYTEKKRIRFTDEGLTLETRNVIPDPVYAGFKLLGKPRVHKTALSNAMAELVAHAVRVLDGKEKPRSNLADAFKTHDACRMFL